MTMAAPTYMRSLTFSAAPHSPSAWAAAASRSSQSTTSSLSHHHHHQINYQPSISTHNTHIYTHHLQTFNSHNDRSYHHHLQLSSGSNNSSGMGLTGYQHQHRRVPPPGLGSPASSPVPSASGAGGRRRSSSIRSKNPPPFIKFDPFADEPLASPPAPAAAAEPALVYQKPSSPAAVSPSASSVSVPYTIQIPAAAPTEIQRYTPSVSSRRISFPAPNPTSSSLNSLMGSRNGGGSGGGSRLVSVGSISPPASSPPSRASTPTPSQGRQTTTTGAGSLGGPNVSRLVAGIMLNRVAVGKPMRRRVPSFGERKREYVKSCLSSVVSVEA